MKVTIPFFSLILLFAVNTSAQTGKASTEKEGSGKDTKSTPAATDEIPEKSFFDQWELVQLSDPASFAAQYKSSITLGKPVKYAVDKPYAVEWVVNPDVLKAYSYHPKEHANVSSGFTYRSQYPAEGDSFDYNPTIYLISLNAGIETSPVLIPNSSSDYKWQTANSKGEANFVLIPPPLLNDRLPYKLAYSASYLDATHPSAVQKNGWRHKASGLASYTLFYRIELLGRYDYTWGSSLDSEKHFYLIEASRDIGGTKIGKELLKIFPGSPRAFIRYYDGGVAPVYKKSHGFEFGIGSKAF